MAAAIGADLEMESLRLEIEKEAERGRGRRWAWAVFLALGVPAGLLVALGPLTAAGIYIEPLRPLWRPWPPDVYKPFIGIAVLCATLACLAFWSGRLAGLRSGGLAALAALRNVLERRFATVAAPDPPPPPPPAIEEVAAADAPAAPAEPPTPPPPPSDEETPKVEVPPSPPIEETPPAEIPP